MTIVALSAESLSALQQRLGIDFQDPDLLTSSLAHRSWCAERGDRPSNERLEFLGDSVLSLAVTRYVYDNFPMLPEGQLSEVRASVVNAKALAEVASELGLGEYLLLGKGEAAAGGRKKQSILADAMEAVIAVVYLDRGWTAARDFVLGLVGERIRNSAENSGGRDFKTRIQEMAAQMSFGRPNYVITDAGPDHEKQFFATLFLTGVAYGTGAGRTKKEAEQVAAEQAWLELNSAIVTASESATDGGPSSHLNEDGPDA